MAKPSQDIFFEKGRDDSPPKRPLAERMRPSKLEEILGQDHVLGKGCLLPKLICENRLGNLIFAGPPGSGKTSLAAVIAAESQCRLIRVNAVTSNVAELREALKLCRYHGSANSYLFVDEIHRFNKSQQDLLLPDLESGHARLIGATTHNPRYYVIDPLLSRSQLFTLSPISADQIAVALKQALADSDRGLGARKCKADEKAISRISVLSDGDLRRAYTFLETIVEALPLGGDVSEETVSGFFAERNIAYDRNEDEHYDTASAFIKSMRGNDPDAALYWLAKMLVGGEEPRFIARRLVIFASEDVGLADSRALLVADAVFRACETIGLPECELSLAHATLFLSTCPKSNSSTLALARAKKEIRENSVQRVPSSIRDKHGRNKKYREQGGETYLYSHDFAENVSGQHYLETNLKLFVPKDSGAETAISERLARWKKLRKNLKAQG